MMTKQTTKKSPLVDHDVLAGPEGAPHVILSNSLGATRSMWDRNVEALRQHFTVVRYDTRGHGRSAVVDGAATIDDLADDVVALLDHLGLDRVHFVGLSLGGMTGMRLAARSPERIRSLVVLCTSAHLPPQGWIERAHTVRTQGTAAVAEAVVDRWYSPEFLNREPERVAAARAVVAATPPAGYAACCDAISTMDLRADLPSICAPTLAIAGADDPATGPPHLKAIADAVQRGSLLVVDESAHLANDEQPAVINAAIIRHLIGTGS